MSDAVEPNLNIETEMLVIRRAFATAFKLVIAAVMTLVFVTGAAICVVAFKNVPLTEKLLIARFIQVSFGMTIGSGCVFFGVILIWLGITASTNVTASNEVAMNKGALQVATASPGVIIALAGIVLIALALYRPLGYKETLLPNDELVPTPVGIKAPIAKSCIPPAAAPSHYQVCNDGNRSPL